MSRNSSSVAAVMLALMLGSFSIPVSAQTIAQRTQAVTDTINNNKDAGEVCAIDFYWEIGDRDLKRASGQKGTAFTASTNMAIYSAGKWLWGAYVFQKRGGQLTAADKDSLRMQSGYNQGNACLFSTTIGNCQSQMNTYTSTADVNNQFYYAGGHFQKHAVNMGHSSKTKPQMVTEMRSQLDTPDGADTSVVFTLNSPVMASGHKTTATNYAVFLRKMLSGTLLLSGGALGSDAVCTYPAPSNAQTGRVQCPGAIYSPTAPIQPGVSEVDGGMNEAWSYSIGHWVETDPVWLAAGGDAAYSSAGAAGFYPWIDQSRTWYGVIARNFLTNTSAGESVRCGRQLRKAWITGIAVPSGTTQ